MVGGWLENGLWGWEGVVHPACHDLRRTYAKISKQLGVSFEALRDNPGHASVVTTERYVGRDIDWSERVPNWTVRIE